MLLKTGLPQSEMPDVIKNYPFDLIEMKGQESVDFLQRITTNDLSLLKNESIQFTLLVSDKGRIIDTAWVILKNDRVLLLVSIGMADDIISWFNKYIIMEDIVLTNVSDHFAVTMISGHSVSSYQTEYFGYPVSFELRVSSRENRNIIDEDFERWRVDNGIPKSRHEIVQDYNPLELNLWNWISFTKGCYIGQEVIARLDTYNKIQRVLCKISSEKHLERERILSDIAGTDVGKITSIVHNGSGSVGLAVIRNAVAVTGNQLMIKDTGDLISIEHVFRKI